MFRESYWGSHGSHTFTHVCLYVCHVGIDKGDMWDETYGRIFIVFNSLPTRLSHLAGELGVDPQG